MDHWPNRGDEEAGRDIAGVPPAFAALLRHVGAGKMLSGCSHLDACFVHIFRREDYSLLQMMRKVISETWAQMMSTPASRQYLTCLG